MSISAIPATYAAFKEQAYQQYGKQSVDNTISSIIAGKNLVHSQALQSYEKTPNEAIKGLHSWIFTELGSQFAKTAEELKAAEPSEEQRSPVTEENGTSATISSRKPSVFKPAASQVRTPSKFTFTTVASQQPAPTAQNPQELRQRAVQQPQPPQQIHVPVQNSRTFASNCCERTLYVAATVTVLALGYLGLTYKS